MKGIKQNILYSVIVAIAAIAEVLYLLFGLRYTQVQTFSYHILTAFILLFTSCIAIFYVDILHELGHIFFGLCLDRKSVV